MTYMHGEVVDLVTKKSVEGAWIDVWQASTNGLYEQQDPDQVEHNLRGKFKTDENGHYAFYCLKPTPYPVPNDGTISFFERCLREANYNTGPAGKLLTLLDRHPYRPAHIHLIVSLLARIVNILLMSSRCRKTATSP